jgi:hypothetical protein
MIENLNDSNLLSKFKKHSQFKNMKLIFFFKNSKYVSIFLIFKSPLPRVKGVMCNVHDIQNEVVINDIRNKNLKELTFFVWFKIMINF